ncbi:ornithine cyclodeaminase (plasmid) [Peteryoungia desertarenae]|uniref:Ornithine cyclodeaminase n=1 Tax=Peteryoungia desertarenae TaxID=1813451 RepID=A0ABX6QT65_9HYPH|nr:ornithine cyclodeaminase [Peteryoungia desertarenae]QLF71798.1 ornithine cyclodeaminase [Peteryoungia desertarenae]
MAEPRWIGYEDAPALINWPDAISALRAGHAYPRAQVADVFLGPGEGSLLSRAAWIDGLGYGVKSVTVFGDNPQFGLPTVQGAMQVFEPGRGVPKAIIESRLITELKTAADSVLGATFLARPDSTTLLIVGAGAVARSLVAAYAATFPTIKRIEVWARRLEQAEAFQRQVDVPGVDISTVTDLAAAASTADIIASATMARQPVLFGKWIRPGTHVDLIGAFKADMREADDDLISMASLYVDSRDTTINHIGELLIPIASGVIDASAVRGDLYDLTTGKTKGRSAKEEVTVFKNGGGAHLDLMIAHYIVATVERVDALDRGPTATAPFL